ncbi:MAG: 16S rRNA (cytosine(1402)-N(4))-methyltransferase RsmH [Rhodobacteraceae bacterium]|nr:16S rRNA (cytosine(1402)-N(4))-methyltransferase RsmH [Paracoccaceae bacterium]
MTHALTVSEPHIPVLLEPILAAVSPVQGRWLDGTFGAGGYTRALLDAGATQVFAIDRDPQVFERAADWADDYGERLVLIEGEFGNLAELAEEHDAVPLAGVVLDIGVSSMQIDQAERGFSFMKDGPLDMRMAQSGMSAAEIVNEAEESVLADILFQYGEERASRRIAHNIVKARKIVPILTTAQLCEVIENSLPRPKPGQVHPATRSFQALRIAVNDELGQLVKGLKAAEAVLGFGGVLAVVTFHSLEDRIVKRFLAARSGNAPKGNRYAPEQADEAPRFELMRRKAIVADATEIEANPRARSAKLRLAKRLQAPAGDIDTRGLGMPGFDMGRLI